MGRGVTTDLSSLYVVAVYYIITSFSSVGYGDVLSTTVHETEYTMFIEMLGIGVFGYMIGII